MTELKNNSCVGQIQIADEVTALIAGTAAAEVEGVALSGTITRDIAGMLGKKNSSKGVHIAVQDKDVTIQLNLLVKLGYKINEIALEVQEKVKTAVETMTGLNVTEVNIHVAGLYLPREKSTREKRSAE